MHWPGTKDKDGKEGVVFIPLQEIVKFSVQDRRILIHTFDDIYYHLDGLDRIELALQSAELPFERADRGHIIDITKIAEIDEDNAIAYFKSTSPEKKGKAATISRPENFKRILSKFREIVRRKNQG